jgi:hypothetical protein
VKNTTLVKTRIKQMGERQPRFGGEAAKCLVKVQHHHQDFTPLSQTPNHEQDKN